jgi:RND family efflux transporter MFP subunit
MKKLRPYLQILVPLLLLAAGILLTQRILRLTPEPTVLPSSFDGPPVRTVTVASEDVHFDVLTQGTIEPWRAIELGAQVGGKVLAVAPSLRAGGFFAAGEVLVQIEATDYELAVVQQEGAVARAELRMLQEQAEADAALRAWQQVEGERPAEPLVRREPQVREAVAALAASQAQLQKARLDLERTRVLAPFAGRVQRANVDLGQLVQPGQPLAQIHDTSCAEVRLPLPASEAGFVDLPLHWSDRDANSPRVPVELTTDFAGRRHRWTGYLVRTESEVDRRSRQWVVVARIDAPYAQNGSADQPPLAIGAFVEASIRGRLQRGLIGIPRSALRGEDEVWLVDAEHRLRRATVQVVRRQADRVWISQGLQDGDRICITPPATPTVGMPVRLLPAPALTAGQAGTGDGGR